MAEEPKALQSNFHGRRTTAVTGPPLRNYDFKTRVVGRSGSLLGYSPFSVSALKRLGERVAFSREQANND